MNGWRGLLAGALGLIILEVIVTSSQATGRVSGFFGGLANAVSWFVSADAPAIPDRTSPSSATSPATQSLVTAPAQATATPAYSSINTK